MQKHTEAKWTGRSCPAHPSHGVERVPSVAATGGLRHLVFHADRNGFDKVVKRAGRRVLIDEEAFFEWVEEQNGDGPGR